MFDATTETDDLDETIDAATALLLWIEVHNGRIDDSNRRKQRSNDAQR
jgi:hypothetical protein